MNCFAFTFATRGRHIRKGFKFGNDDRDIAVKSGMRAKEIEISDKERNARNSALVSAVTGSRFVISFDKILGKRNEF